MTPVAFFLILTSVVMHASWHFINKTGRPTYPYFCVFSFALFLTMLPLLLLSGIKVWLLPPQVLFFILAGGFFGMLGDVGLSWAYRTTDMSVSYPLARALPVLMTMLITAVFSLGKPLNIAAFSGMTVIFAGCVMTGWSNGSKKILSSMSGKGFAGIFLAALATTAYTITDSYGIRGMTEACKDIHPLLRAGSYSCMREFTVLICLVLITLPRKAMRKKFDRKLLLSWHPYAAGAIAAIAYVLVLISMDHVTNVSFVQAFRQMSLPVGALLGFVILKERPTLLRIAGLGTILAGLLISALL